MNALKTSITATSDFRCRLVKTTAKPPFLRVINPDASDLAEDITCRMEDDGEPWYFWSWGDTIGPASDPSGVATVVTRVLSIES